MKQHANPPPQLRTSAIYANRTNYNIINVIHSTIGNLPLQIIFKVIKGRQDKKTMFHKLSCKAQLNVLANATAGAFQQDGSQDARSRCHYPSTPYQQATLSINSHAVTCNHKHLLCTASLLPPLKAYTIDHHKLSPQAWENIHWPAHGQAMASLSIPRCLTITKFLHCSPPTGHQLHKMDKTVPTTCGACTSHNKTDDHVCCCKHPAIDALRTKALESLEASMTTNNTDPTLQTLLIYRICKWFLEGSPLIDMSAPSNHPYSNQLNQAISDQNMIGWD